MKFRIEDITLPSQKEVAKLFECSICLNVLHDPVQTKCGHVFCGECLEKARNRLCPVCKTENDADDVKLLKDVNIPMYRMMGKIPVRCPFSQPAEGERPTEGEPLTKRQRADHFCLWTGAYADLLEVHLGECRHVRVDCPYCSLELARKDLAAHEQQCEQRYQVCSICGERMRSEEEHMQKFAFTHVTILQSQLQEAQRHSTTEATVLSALSAVPQQVSKLQTEMGKCAKTATMTSKFSEIKAFRHPIVGEKFKFVVKGVSKLLREYPNKSDWMSPADLPMGFRISLYPHGDEQSELGKYAFFVETVGIAPCITYDLDAMVGTKKRAIERVSTDGRGDADYGLTTQLMNDTRDDTLSIVLTVTGVTRRTEIVV